MTKRRDRTGNYGIQADSVTAGALAVGKGATATQNVTGGTDSVALLAAVAELKAALAQAELPAQTRAVLGEDVAEIAREAAEDNADPDRLEALLRGLVGKVKMAGEFTGAVADLIDPIRKIVAAVGLGVGALGLL